MCFGRELDNSKGLGAWHFCPHSVCIVIMNMRLGQLFVWLWWSFASSQDLWRLATWTITCNYTEKNSRQTRCMYYSSFSLKYLVSWADCSASDRATSDKQVEETFWSPWLGRLTIFSLLGEKRWQEIKSRKNTSKAKRWKDFLVDIWLRRHLSQFICMLLSWYPNFSSWLGDRKWGFPNKRKLRDDLTSQTKNGLTRQWIPKPKKDGRNGELVFKVAKDVTSYMLPMQIHTGIELYTDSSMCLCVQVIHYCFNDAYYFMVWYTTIYLSSFICWWTFELSSIFDYWEKEQLWTFLEKSFCKYVYISLRFILLDKKKGKHLSLLEITNEFSKVNVPFYTLISSVWECCSTFSTFVLSVFLLLTIQVG